MVAAAAAGPVLEGLPLDGGGIPQEEDRKPIREYIYKGAIMSLHGTSTARVLNRIYRLGPVPPPLPPPPQLGPH